MAVISAVNVATTGRKEQRIYNAFLRGNYITLKKDSIRNPFFFSYWQTMNALIPGYNTADDVAASEAWLKELGIFRIDHLTYRTDEHIKKV